MNQRYASSKSIDRTILDILPAGREGCRRIIHRSVLPLPAYVTNQSIIFRHVVMLCCDLFLTILLSAHDMMVSDMRHGCDCITNMWIMILLLQ